MNIRPRIMRNHNLFAGLLGCGFVLAVGFPVTAIAAPLEITLRHKHHIFTVKPAQYPSWRSSQEEFRYKGEAFRAPQGMRIDGDTTPALPPGITRTTVQQWDTAAIAATLQQKIAPALDREPGTVRISRTLDGSIAFEGAGLPGRKLNSAAAAALIAEALSREIADVTLPIITEQPAIIVLDQELRQAGITEVVSVGESDFSGSPLARRHNIAVGLEKFNGHLIPKDTVFSFNEVLGPVNAATGYKKELVILGERTLPDYGGGLCQVSTTAYRGVWEYGLPIEDRRNHSFAVRYYAPQGTDATIYPPNTDMQFTNDTPGALLMQTYVQNDKAYFIYYGTKDDRRSEIYGPYTWGRTEPPPDRSEYTTEIPAGTTRKVGDRVPGMRAAWFRVTSLPETAEDIIEPVYSVYEARPLFMQIGVAAGSSLLGGSASSESTASVMSEESPSSRVRSSARPVRRGN